MQKAVQNIDVLARKAAIVMIWLYQRTLSPNHSFIIKMFFPYGYCKFYPSCSEYAKRCFQKHKSHRALRFSLFRLLRCHPWSRGGFDNIPQQHTK